MAAQLGLSGKAVIACEANPQGVPTNCHSVSSAPAHLGFDRAAINVVQRGRVAPAPEGNTRPVPSP
ncbi:TonB family protein [Brevundimonas sp.]